MPWFRDFWGRARGLKVAGSGDTEREVLVEWVLDVGGVVVEA